MRAKWLCFPILRPIPWWTEANLFPLWILPDEGLDIICPRRGGRDRTVVLGCAEHRPPGALFKFVHSHARGLHTHALWHSAGRIGGFWGLCDSGCSFPRNDGGGYLLQFGILSFVIPLLLRRGIAWDRTVVLNVCAVMLVAGVLLVGFSVIQEVSPAQMIRQQADLAVAQALEFYDQGQFPVQERDQFESTLGEMADIFVRIFPALGAVIVAGLSLLTVLLLNSFSAGRYRVPGPEFAAWRSPEFLIWGVIAAGFSMLIDQSLLRTVAMNLLILLLPVYFVQGVAVVSHFLKRRAVAPIIRSLVYFLIFILNPLPLVVTGVGMFDLWIDFRKPKIKKTS